MGGGRWGGSRWSVGRKSVVDGGGTRREGDGLLLSLLNQKRRKGVSENKEKREKN